MRDTIQLMCTKCKRKNYVASRNKRIKTKRMEIRKYCKFDKCHTIHKESK